MAHRLRAHPVAIVTAGMILGLGGGLAATAQAATSSPPTTASASGPSTAGPSPRGQGRPGRHGDGRGGTVTAVSGSAITYAGPDGTSHTAGLNGATTYTRDGTSAKQSDLAVGQRIHVRLVDPTASTITAAAVDIESPHIGGTVASATGTTIVVIDGQGFHRTIHTNATTTYTSSGQPATSVAVAVGQHVNAVGSIDPNGTDLDATRVEVGRFPRRPPGPVPDRRAPKKG